LNCDTGFAFYFERELYFSLTRKTVFSKKTALSFIFFRISIDNLGPYMWLCDATRSRIWSVVKVFRGTRAVGLFMVCATVD